MIRPKTQRTRVRWFFLYNHFKYSSASKISPRTVLGGDNMICMAYRKDPLVEGEYYHLYNRGNSKQDIFLDEEDRSRFIKLLFLCNSERGINFRDDIVDSGIDAFDFDRGENLISIGAWVLMSNHFHLYVTSKKSPEDGPREVMEEDDRSTITEFMRKLLTGYSSYFNKKYNRTGALFEGKIVY